MSDVEHELRTVQDQLRVLQSALREHRGETEAQAKAIRQHIELAVGNAMRVEVARELVAEHPELSEPVRAWLARYGLALEEHLADD